MLVEIYMPQLGLTMSEGTVIRWLKATGQTVAKGEGVVEIETDKATAVIESPADGVLDSTLCAEGDTVPIGVAMGYVLASAGASAASPAAAPPTPEKAVADVPAPPAPAARGADRPTPVTPAPVGGYGEAVPVSLTAMADGSALADLCAQLTTAEAELTAQSCYDGLLLKIGAAALVRFPDINVQLEESVAKRLTGAAIGLLFATAEGFSVAVVHDAARKGLKSIAQELRSSIKETHSAVPAKLPDGTCRLIVARVGISQANTFAPLAPPLPTALLSIEHSSLGREPMEGQGITPQTMWLTLTFDQRMVDAAYAARFLRHVKELLERPWLLLA